MKKTSYLALALIGLMLVGGLYYFVRDEQVPVQPPVAQEAKSDNLPGIVFSGSSVIEHKDGLPLWELSAEKIEANTNIIIFTNPKAIYYQGQNGKTELTAKQATMDPKTKDIVMDGQVRAVTGDGALYTSDNLRYAAQDARFYGAGNVVLNRNGTILTGDRIESDNKFEKVQLRGNAKVLKGGETR